MPQTGLEPVTHEFSVRCSTIGATVALFGTPPGTRTPTNSFGDCHAAITLEMYKFGGSRGNRTLLVTMLAKQRRSPLLPPY